MLLHKNLLIGNCVIVLNQTLRENQTVVKNLLSTLLIVLCACIDPVTVNIEDEINVLIVEGSISTKPGTHFVRLTLSAKYGSIQQGYIRPVVAASVSVRDSYGEVSFWEEGPDAPGVYFSPAGLTVEVGSSYTLLIKTKSGNEYTSLPELVHKSATILGLTSEFRKEQISENTYRSGLNVLTTFNDEPDLKNFYMWRSTSTYKIKTFPELYDAPGPGYNLFPKDCCKFCWVDEINGDESIRILSDINMDGNKIINTAAFIEDDGLRYYDKYLVRVEQHSLTREAFQFFSLLKEQLSIEGDIFDPPPATLRGNMINLTNLNENVIGYFWASDVSIDSLFLTRDMLEEIMPLRQYNDDCRNYQNGYTEEPSYW